MKKIVFLFSISLILLKINALDLSEESIDVYDEENPESRDYSSQDESEEDVQPEIYDLKDAPKLFKKFIKDYHKEYRNAEDYKAHYNNFVSNLKYMNKVNKEGRSAAVGINLFADLSEKETDLLG